MRLRTIMSSVLLAGTLLIGSTSVFASQNLMETVQPLFGVPYQSGGISTKGFDCSGFTRYVFQAMGVALPHSSLSQFTVGQAVDKSNLQLGDLVFFNTNGYSVSHVGIYVGNNTFVHSESGRGVVKTSLSDPHYWSKRYVGAKRVSLPDANTTQTAQANVTKERKVQAASVDNTKK